MTTLDDLLDGIEAAEGNAIERYEHLARQLHVGENVSPVDVSAVLKEAGKTPQDLRRLVALLTRCGAAAEHRQAARLYDRNGELEQQIEMANADLEQAIAACRAKVQPLRNEIDANNIAIMRAGGAGHELLESCADPALRGRRDMVALPANKTQSDARYRRQAGSRKGRPTRLLVEGRAGASRRRYCASCVRVDRGAARGSGHRNGVDGGGPRDA